LTGIINTAYKSTDQQGFWREFLMRTFGAAILATTLIYSSAFAATVTSASAPLAPGKPAGVKNAEMTTNQWWWIGGVAAVGLTVGLVASGDDNAAAAVVPPPSTVTTSTSTSP
jgi:predicted cobalt transporter CbtA